MKNIMKRTTIALLTASLLFVLVPVFSSTDVVFGIAEPVYAADDGVYRKLMSLQEKFPDGKYWNHIVPASEQGENCHNEAYADSVTDHPCANHKGQAETGQYDCNYFDGGLQCCGFARKVFYDLFGEREKSIESQKHNGTEGISVGDFVSFNTTEHYAIVLGISGQTLTLVQCNLDQMGVNYNCMISWGRTCSASEIAYYVHSNKYDEVNHACVAHTWNAGKVKKKATLKANGKKVMTCKVCGEKKTVVIPRPKKFVVKKKFTYNGKGRKPKVTVKDAKGKVIPSKYYKVTYKANKEVGKAKVIVKFKGVYSGKKSLTFKIIPKGTKIKKCTGGTKKIKVIWKKKSGISGYQIQYATNAGFSKKKTITVKGSKKTSKVIKKLKAGTKYFVRVRTFKNVGKKKYCSDWSAVKKASTKKPSVKAAYKPIRTEYKKFLKRLDSGEEIDVTNFSQYGYKYVSADIAYAAVVDLRGTGETSRPKYAYKDINGDGTKEFIVGEKVGGDDIIGSIFTLNKSGRPVALIHCSSYMYRGYVRIFKGGMVEDGGSSGAAYHQCVFYTLPAGSSKLKVKYDYLQNEYEFTCNGEEMEESDFWSELGELESKAKVSLTWKAF